VNPTAAGASRGRNTEVTMFEIVKAKSGPDEGKLMWNLRLAAGGRVIAVSEQAFAKRSAVIADIARVKKIAADAPVVEVLA
jgi:uncharacterized protein YegP (UPF0339 family)